MWHTRGTKVQEQEIDIENGYVFVCFFCNQVVTDMRHVFVSIITQVVCTLI